MSIASQWKSTNKKEQFWGILFLLNFGYFLYLWNRLTHGYYYHTTDRIALIMLLIPIFGLLYINNYRARKRWQEKTIRTLIESSRIYEIDELMVQSEMTKSSVRTIIGNLLTSNKIQGKLTQISFEPKSNVMSSGTGFGMTQPTQNDEFTRIRKALRNLEAKYKSNEVDEGLYYKLKAEYQSRLLDGKV